MQDNDEVTTQSDAPPQPDPDYIYCRDCGGSGALGDRSVCTTCEGSGHIVKDGN